MGRIDLGSRIQSLLDDDRVEVRCAAALCLGAAGKGDSGVGRVLARKRSADNPLVRRFVLDALVATGARGLAKELTPLLGASDEEVREKAMRLLAAQGNGAGAALVKAISEGPAAARRQAV